MPLRDAYNRKITDLRISLTDRCNFRCFYCLPNGEPPLARKDTILTFEEITFVSEIFVSLGIEKLRLTGGEPLLRKDIHLLIAQLSKLKPALQNIALTTNGSDFPRRAARLRAAGLDRVTFSLDSLDRENFTGITGVDALKKTLTAIDAAKRHKFTPIKVNAVIVRGRNDHEIPDFARFAREHAVDFRFIEFMPLDSGNEWSRESVVSGREIRETINEIFPLICDGTTRGSETAWRYRFADGAKGSVGIIAPVTEMFCGACSRIRLTADGQIRTCLFSTTEYNLRDLVRGGANRREIADFIRDVVNKKEPQHYIGDAAFIRPSRSMSFIGG